MCCTMIVRVRYTWQRIQCYHFIWSLIEDGVLKLVKIIGSKNPADMLTKPVTTEKLELCTASVGFQG